VARLLRATPRPRAAKPNAAAAAEARAATEHHHAAHRARPQLQGTLASWLEVGARGVLPRHP
jgi:hypothetical protein